MIKIRDGFKIPGVRELHWNIKNKHKCLFAAKGPSLNSIDKYRDFGHIATVNEACLRVSGPIEYAFFYDNNTVNNSRPVWDKIKTFVMSSILYGDKIDDKFVSISDIDGLPLDRAITFYEDQHIWDHNAVEISLMNGRFINTDTAVMGLHFLILHGYTDIKLLGHDGGIGYADGVYGTCEDRNMARFRNIMEFVVKLFTEKYGVNIEFVK